MKKYILLAAAAIAALSACNNESDEIINTPEIPAEEIPSVQAPVFTASIEGSGTRTAIDGNKVNWVNDDEVLMVYVGGSEDDGDFDAMSMATYQATPSAVDATKATLTIKNWLHEDENANILMFAIYPASLFDLQNGLNFPATQVYAGDGQIPYAPMAVNNVEALRGEGEPIPSTLNFVNAGALLKITVPYSQMHSVSSITVSSNLAMNGAATIGGSGNLYIQEPETVTTENSKITLDCGTGVTIPEGSDKTFYVSILAPGSHFTCQYDYLQIDVTDGITTKSMRTTKAGGIQIERNKIYPITFAKNYTPTTAHDYVQIGGIKWATMNVGATTVAGSPATCFGHYFAWGETEPRYTGITITDDAVISFTEWKSNHSSGYAQSDYPTFNESALDDAHDAATQTWGSGWRTPTKEDFKSLYDACNTTARVITPSAQIQGGGIYWLAADQTFESEYTGVAGYLFVEVANTSNRVFFPAVGFASYEAVYYAGEYAVYWASIHHPEIYYAYNLSCQDNNIYPESPNDRSRGLAVRPVVKE